MINKDRIVPVTKTDLLSLYSVVLTAAGVELQKAEATDIDGAFDIQDVGGVNMIANQPVISVEINGADSVEFYFVADNAYKGFTQQGVVLEVEGDVIADGSLYKASITDGGVTGITKVGF